MKYGCVKNMTDHAVVTTSKKLLQPKSSLTKSTRNTRATILVPAASGQKTSSKNKHSSLVIQVRRVYSERMVYVETKVDIKGRLLLEELKLIHGDTHGVFLGESSNTVHRSFQLPLIDRMTKTFPRSNLSYCFGHVRILKSVRKI